MCRENPLWGAPRIHGELLKLGFDVSERTVSRYALRHPKPSSQTWRTFLENHVGCLALMDLCVVPTAAFQLLYGFIILRHDRRRIVHFGSWRFHKSAGSITATSASRPDPGLAYGHGYC